MVPVARWEKYATPVTTKWFVCKYSAHCGSTRVVQGLVDSLVLPVKKKSEEGLHTSPPVSGTTRVSLPVL